MTLNVLIDGWHWFLILKYTSEMVASLVVMESTYLWRKVFQAPSRKCWIFLWILYDSHWSTHIHSSPVAEVAQSSLEHSLQCVDQCWSVGSHWGSEKQAKNTEWVCSLGTQCLNIRNLAPDHPWRGLTKITVSDRKSTWESWLVWSLLSAAQLC